MSAFWILSANSFMQHPVGVKYVENNVIGKKAEMIDFFAIVKNPYLWNQFPHVVTMALTVGAFTIAGIASWKMVRKQEVAVFRKAFKVSIVAALIGSLGLFWTGHSQMQYLVREYPMKVAAAEALYEDTGNSAAFSVLATIDQKQQKAEHYIEVPGGAEDIRKVLLVDNKADKEAGSYNFVTVGVEQATFAHLVYAWLTPFTDIYSAKDMTGGSTDEEFNRINQFYMETSQNMAKYQGLTTAGKEIKMDYLGVYVLQVADNSTFKGVLNIADTVTGVNDKTFESSEELVKYVNSQKLGDKIKVTFQEDGQEKSATGKVIKLENGKNGIGISLIDRTEVSSNIPITFSTEGIGGPSAGLMFSLAIYTQLADPTLRDGRDIAGTGSISREGEVGEIGGIDKKVVSAAQSGADIFFAPNNELTEEEKKLSPNGKNNYQTALETAKKIKTDMKIVPVKTLQDAIDYLKKNK